ncbi:MAG TPA: matrixin family metalloprotease, partial [Pseudobdellovibrionaceae bacterium]|nr:matrixin family metalloprotease [Pseudobdellovibrionaceae bacterium]
AAGEFSYYMSRGPAARRYNIEAVALHELGHVLGLKHPDETSVNTVMSPKLLENSDRIELTEQDLKFLKCEY